MTSVLRFALLSLGSAAVVALAGCSTKDHGENADLVAGKTLFVQKCGSCHILERAGTKGTVGPNLDSAFANPVEEGFGESAIRGMVYNMIDIGAAELDGETVMKPDIVTGDDADSVASYVALAVSDPGGKDEGLLATAGQAKTSDKPAVAKGGTLSIPADPAGSLAYVFSEAQAAPGQLKVESPNESSTPHDIVIDGKGDGEDIADGAVSSFTASFAAGEYTYYCSLPGHREAGMEGKLTVK